MFPCARRPFPRRNFWGTLFGSGREKPGLGGEGMSWFPALLWVSRPWLGLVGALTDTEQPLLSWSWGLFLQGLLEQDTGSPHWPLLTFFLLPEFQELCWNTKPRCQRHLASAAFHHKTLRHENVLPCHSSACLMPGVPWPCWRSCQGGPWSLLGASAHREVRV